MSDEIPKESETREPAIKLFHIYEHDLAELERVLPQVYDACMVQIANNPRLRVQYRRLKEIVSNVRWNYGPHLECHESPADGYGPITNDT